MANVKDLLVNGSARVIGTIYGNATSANKLNTNAGSASQPVYFSNGVPVAITGSLSNNAASATKLLNARNFKIGNTSKSFNGTADVTWTHAEIGATVSNTWTGGTTAGPTLSTTVNGVKGTAVAIPNASTSASGIVTTGAQSFAGNKTFANGITLGGNIHMGSAGTPSSYPYIGNKITWDGGTDGAQIYYQIDSADAGRLVLNTTDDTNCLIALAYNGTAKSYINTSTPSFYPSSNNTGSIGLSSNKWASMYATTFYGALSGNATTATGLSSIIANDKLPDRLREYHTSGMTLDSTACGWYYAGSNNTSPFTTASDFMVMNQGYNTSWGSQIATDFRSNRLAVRNKNNGTWNSWVRVLDQNTGVARAHYGTTSSSSEDYILITINKETNWMLNFTIKLYQSYIATDIQVSGYNYGANHWYSPNAIILGSTITSGIKVYFGYTGDFKLWVAVDGDWYTGIDVIDAVNGHVQISLDDAFTITRVNSLPGTLQSTITAYRPYYRNETVSNATIATKLATARTIQTNLASTTAASFDGSANITPGITGTLPISHGGTGQTSIANIQAGKDGDGNTITSKYVSIYNSNNIGQSSSVTVNDLAKQGSAVGMIYNSTDNPLGASKWVHVWSQAWNKGVNSSWVSQIAAGVGNSDGLYYRTTQGNVVGTTWKRLLDSSNYTNYNIWNKIKSNNRFYPLIGNAYGSAWYKITWPFPNTPTSTKWMMISMDVTFGGPHDLGSSGKIQLSYYFYYNSTSNTWSAENVRGIVLGNNINSTNIQIKYNIAEPNIMYIKVGHNHYRGISIENLYAHDSAPSYDFLTTKIETCAEPDSTVYNSSVPLVFYGSDNGVTAKINNDLVIGSASIGTNGYITGTWLKTTGNSNGTGNFVTQKDGWLYYRTPAETRGDINAPSTTGAGASGTWGISISGNAATATTLATARTITVGAKTNSFNGSANITFTPFESRLVRALYNTDSNLNDFANRGHALGMCSLGDNGSVDNPGGKTGWHHVINLTWTDAADNNGTTTNEWCTQIANACGSSDLYIRSRGGGSITNGTAWGAPWTKILTASNYTGTLDSRYVLKSGDTMTGNLTVPSVYTSNWFRSTGSTGWYNETYGGGLYMTDSTYLRNYAGKATRLDNLCLGADNNKYRLYVSGQSYFTDITIHKGWAYFGGTTYYISDSADAMLRRGEFAGTSNENTASQALYFHAGLQIREAGRVADSQSSFNFAPRIGFDWLNKAAGSLSLAANGIFYFRKQNGTDRATVDANLSGNADTATKLQTSRTISLTGSVIGSGTFDGSGNLSISTTTNHNHDSNYVKKSGDTMSGVLYTPCIAGSTTCYVAFPSGGRYDTGESAVTGAFKITLPTFKACTMLRFYVDIYNYNEEGAITYLISGYPYSDGNWYNYTAQAIGTSRTTAHANLPVRFGHDGSKNCIWIGDTTTSWSYPHVQIRDFMGGHATDYASSWATGWSITLVTSFDTVTQTITTTNELTMTKVYGAVWNDYAEYRTGPEEFKPGQVVYEVGDDSVSLSTKRLQRGCSIISDTYGFAIGETNQAKCPLAVSGRVLAYGYEPIEEFKSHIGYPVCSGPNGTVSIMTDEEEEKYPSRIIGIISAVPEYEEWGTGKVKVDGRIWIKLQ